MNAGLIRRLRTRGGVVSLGTAVTCSVGEKPLDARFAAETKTELPTRSARNSRSTVQSPGSLYRGRTKVACHVPSLSVPETSENRLLPTTCVCFPDGLRITSAAPEPANKAGWTPLMPSESPIETVMVCDADDTFAVSGVS